MSFKQKRVFSAERSTKAVRNESATLGDVLDSLSSLEKSLHNKISQKSWMSP